MEWASGNIFIRPTVFQKAGEKINGHEHQFDHTSIVFTGSVRVKAVFPETGKEVTQEFHAPAHFLVKANVKHEITALEDGTIFWCVYAHRTPQGDVVQQHIGWTDAYI